MSDDEEVLDALAIGIGPFNAGLATLAHEFAPELRLAAIDRRKSFEWHRGMQIAGSIVQVPFLADFVSLVAPHSRFSFLAYLHAVGRLQQFYVREDMHVPRCEFEAYGQWVVAQLPNCHWGHDAIEAEHVGSPGDEGYFKIRTRSEHTTKILRTRALVLGTGAEPSFPSAWSSPSIAETGSDASLFHSSQYLRHRDECSQHQRVVVIGSGQSAAEIVLDLLERRPLNAPAIIWLTRSAGFFPMEYSKLGLEHFSPQYTDLFHGLTWNRRQQLLADQDLLYKGISATTIAAIYERLYHHTTGRTPPPLELYPQVEVSEVHAPESDGSRTLALQHKLSGESSTIAADRVIAATGYTPRLPPCVEGLLPHLACDPNGRPLVERNYRCRSETLGPIFLQGLELHSHGVGAPDLGMAAYRSAAIINQLAGRSVLGQPQPQVFSTFGRLPAETTATARQGI